MSPEEVEFFNRMIDRRVDERLAKQSPRDPEVVAKVQQALMKHPHFKGNSATAFGFANTAIDAYAVAVSSPLHNTQGE